MASPLRPSYSDDDYEQNRPQPQPSAEGGGPNKLMQILQAPGVSSALLGFGAGMLQPVGPGETQFGNVAKGLTGAGEAERLGQEQETTQTKLGIAQQEASSKEALRGAQAEAAGSRSGREADRAYYAAQRLQDARDAVEQRDQLQEILRAQEQVRAVNEANKAIEGRNALRTSKDPKRETPQPVPTLDEAVAQIRATRQRPGRGGQGGGGSAPTPEDIQSLRSYKGKPNEQQAVDAFERRFGTGSARAYR